MLGTENTLRSGHLLLLLLVASSVLLGISYLNEMYQRIQLQTDLAFVERQTQRAVSERSVIEHRAAQLQIKLEAANQDKKRLQEIQKFQLQQQNAKFETEKKDRLEDISVNEKKMAELQGQYDGLKVLYDHLHSEMDQFQKNQSRLLEKFATQSTQCMNVISMMNQLCNKGKKIPLLFFKQKNILMTAVTSQPPTVTNKPENSSLSPEDGFIKTQMTLMQDITETPFLSSGGKQRHLSPEVNDLSSEPETTGRPEKDVYNATTPEITAQESNLNVSTQEKMTSTTDPPLGTLQNQSFQYEGEHDKKNDKNGNSTTQWNKQEKWILKSHKRKQNMFGNVIYSEHVGENEGIAQTKQRLQLTTSSHNLTSTAITNVTQDYVERIVNLTLTTQDTTIGKNPTEGSSKVNSENTTLSVDNTEKNDKDVAVKEEKEEKYKGIHITDSNRENQEKLQTLEFQY